MQERCDVMMQYFHWYTTDDGSWWRQLSQDAEKLADIGVSAVWLPPANKCIEGNKDAGYGSYDLYDLGEFNQKNTVRTKYGTAQEYIEAIKVAQRAGLHVYADIVFNHKLGGDAEEEFNATPYDPNNRNQCLGEACKIKAWTQFNFDGRNNCYSDFKWHWYHFNAVDSCSIPGNAIYLFEGKHFDNDVDHERGNYDFLMGCDIDMNDPEVTQELRKWGEWFYDRTGVDGFRFDAVKHVKAEFFYDWLEHMRQYSKRPLFAVGEYWANAEQSLEHFIQLTKQDIRLFDVGLHYNFYDAGRAGRHYDLRNIFKNSLANDYPDMAVTLVTNHDTQPLQALESPIENNFTPLAYAMILLRRGAYPCLFAADYYGATYTDKGHDGKLYTIVMQSYQDFINQLMYMRRHYAWGEQTDYLEDAHCIGWVRHGNDEHPFGCVVILSNTDAAKKTMQTNLGNTTYIDYLGNIKQTITTDANGNAEFLCNGQAVSVWIPKIAVN